MIERALSIRQPWAWLILYAGKDIENRTWWTCRRGRHLIHASKGMTRAEYEDARYFASGIVPSIVIPPAHKLQRGGIVGSVEIVDCVEASGSQWFFGPHGFVLRAPQSLQFKPCKGALGFFRPQFEPETKPGQRILAL